MDSNSVVFDISSDEELAIEEPKEFDDDCNWLTELLRNFDKENDDSDDVVIVGEYKPPKPKSKSKSSNQMADIKFFLDDDDDCVVLSGDPEKPVAAAADVCRNEADSSDDGDDVLVVGEKGQVACRDYPHPRHLCVEFPFGSTPHERHCHLCHCYVCDSIAPCVHWGTGFSTSDHCHATDKQELWKTQREFCRIGKDAPVPVSKLPDDPVPMSLPQLNQVGSRDIAWLIPDPIPHNQSLTHNPMLQNQVSRIPTLRSCSSSTTGIPNIIRHRSRQLGCVIGRNRPLPRSVSQQALGVRSDVQKDRCPNALGHRFVSSSAMYKRQGLAAHALGANHPTHVSLNMKYAPASGYARNVAPLATSKENPSSLHYVLPNAIFESHTYQSSPQPNMGSVIVNTVPLRSELGSQPTPQSNNGQSIYEHGNQGENDADLFFSDLDFCQVNNSSQSDQGASIENIFHGTMSNNEPSTVKLLNSQLAEIESAQLQYEDHELVDSFFLNQAVPVVSESFVPCDLNGFSPEPPAIDTVINPWLLVTNDPDTDAVKKGPICSGLGHVQFGMALWMEAGSEPKTESEIADLQAISALKHSTALELKEKGNEYVKMGKKHYSDAIECYTRAINQEVLSDSDNSIVYSNRAHVNLLLGNYRRALTDAREAIKLCPTSVKAMYRAAKASLSLNLLVEAKSFCENGLEQNPDNEELKRLAKQINLVKMELDKREAEVSKAVSEAKDLLSAIEDRGLKMGKPMFGELVGLRKPVLDKNKILHWPALLLYAEVMSSDFIEDFCETDMFSAHLDMISILLVIFVFITICPINLHLMFPALLYILHYMISITFKHVLRKLSTIAGSGVPLSKKKILHHLLDGTLGASVESVDEEKEAIESNGSGKGSSKWVKVNEKRMLSDVLKEPDFIISGIPGLRIVFYVVSKRSSFYKEFKAGKWSLPS
ncbi:hypothetical protein DKX38_003629 [Salix brachista]|uniref:Uncharacterized protein n=1 Tax=Salix brachista TaxID=2182728 RepID=A0A5N5NT91_9ROSI|nr:hypothetical protein DKX38_003629 [Salix brachista]